MNRQTARQQTTRADLAAAHAQGHAAGRKAAREDYTAHQWRLGSSGPDAALEHYLDVTAASAAAARMPDVTRIATVYRATFASAYVDAYTHTLRHMTDLGEDDARVAAEPATAAQGFTLEPSDSLEYLTAMRDDARSWLAAIEQRIAALVGTPAEASVTAH